MLVMLLDLVLEELEHLHCLFTHRFQLAVLFRVKLVIVGQQAPEITSCLRQLCERRAVSHLEGLY